MSDDLELRLRRFFSNSTLSPSDTRAVAQLHNSAVPASGDMRAHRVNSKRILVRGTLAVAVLLLTFIGGFSVGELQQKPQVFATTPLGNQLAQTTMVQSAPTSWTQASNTAQAVGDTLVQPSWLPFDSAPPAVQQSIDSHGQLLFTTSQYTSTNGSAWILVGQAHVKTVGAVKYNHPTGSTTVGNATATIFQLTISTQAGTASEIGIGWVGTNGKLITVTARGVSVDDLVKVARSIS